MTSLKVKVIGQRSSSKVKVKNVNNGICPILAYFDVKVKSEGHLVKVTGIKFKVIGQRACSQGQKAENSSFQSSVRK